MKTKFTPGPWAHFGPLKFTVYGGDPVRRIAVIDFVSGQESEESDSNARLIAAAPELYEALAEVLAELDSRDAPQGTIYRDTGGMALARAALAKVEG